MPRAKKQHLKKRKDGRYACRYKDQWFYSTDPDEALEMREEYKRLEKIQAGASPTVKDYGKKWLERAYPAAAETTKNGLRIHLKKLTDLYGDLLLSDVKPSHIKTVYSQKYIGLSNSYIKAGKQLFSALFDAAVADGYIRSNPAKLAKPHKGTEGGHRAITAQEREWINTYCHDHRAYPAIITMLYAGIRPQEAKALKIEKAYDPDNGVLHIRETAHRDGNNQYKITEQGKTKNAIRDIPIFPPVDNALKDKKGFLITTARGKQITSTTWYNAIESYRTCMETAINGCHKRWYGKTKEHKRILAEAAKLRAEGRKKEAEAKAAEISPWIEFTVVPYDLRHSFCVMCRDNGVEINTCIRWMGHADATMILKVYDEASNDRSKKEAEKLSKALFGSQNGSQSENREAVNDEIK